MKGKLTQSSKLSETDELHTLLLCFVIILLSDFKLGEACAAEGAGNVLLCRACGHELAFEKDANFIPSRLALSHRNDTVLGDRRIPVQLFENPQGYQYEVMTFRKADVVKHWPADKHFTWYPGYSWTMVTCPRCNTHLGWAFQPSGWPKTVTKKEFEASEQTFLALITHRLLQENVASRLLITPKSFRS